MSSKETLDHLLALIKANANTDKRRRSRTPLLPITSPDTAIPDDDQTADESPEEFFKRLEESARAAGRSTPPVPVKEEFAA